MKKSVETIFKDLFLQYPDLGTCQKDIYSAYVLLETCYKKGGKVLVCGNGGSAADAEHIVGELMKEFWIKRPAPSIMEKKLRVVDEKRASHICESLQQALPAISLVSQTSLFTAYVNDVDADMAFAQQVYGYGQNHDVLIALSTSGNSPNVCNAACVARSMDMAVLGMTGETGGALSAYCTACIAVPSTRTYRIQEYHLPVYHSLCLALEEEFFGEAD